MMKSVYSTLTIAYRDILKFFRDPGRIVATFIFPAIFIVILGKGLQTGVGQHLSFDLLTFTFTGVLAQTMFQSAASGVVSLIEDRENDFSQEIFVSPISRYVIIFGKILGESTLALFQAIGIVIIGLLIGAEMSVSQLVSVIPVLGLACLFGAAFGVLVLSNLSSQRAANQIFPFILFPQFFLAGIFSPINNLPWYLDILSKIAPLTYIVDLIRNVYYSASNQLSYVTVYPLWLDLTVVTGMFLVFIVIGTWLFVRNEKNK